MSNLPSDSSVVRVLVVDDSAFMRFTISKHLNETPGISVIGAARDGREALELIPKLNPDVITLDVEMPRLDGLSTLREIMTSFPRPVVMLSSLTSEGTVETVQALTLGAVDFVAKPEFKANINSVLQEVSEKVLKASKARVWSIKRQVSTGTTASLKQPIVENKQKPRPLSRQEKVVVIGSSTGGPRALNAVIPSLPEKLPAAVVVIQHMPAGFTRSLAERLDAASRLKVKEAEPGDTLEVGKVLMAPGGFHMVFDNQGFVTLNQNPPVHGVRPAVDVTLISLAQLYGNRIVSVILTGMGNDGTNGAGLVHGSGGWVIAEAEESCVVWGMPRSVTEAGFTNQVVPLTEVAQSIVKAVES
ncbi:MAG: chemotaxis response regulator protein-glutamate methylesterase [Anaerolineae bacterium]|nr:chemotaxis response regulator protein-glutamate methylesterase [Anaerolineae bacterium]